MGAGIFRRDGVVMGKCATVQREHRGGIEGGCGERYAEHQKDHGYGDKGGNAYNAEGRAGHRAFSWVLSGGRYSLGGYYFV